METYLEELQVNQRQWLYVFYIDGKRYDSFACSAWLTFSERADVVQGYQTALEGHPINFDKRNWEKGEL